MQKPPSDLRSFEAFVQIVAALRGPDGCPWDKEQTHRSLTQYAIEEAHELADAIENHGTDEVREELGDLLLQVVLHAEIARQEGKFDIYDVIAGIGEKMVRRHPHVFSDVQVRDSADVLARWDELKARENPQSKNPFAKLPVTLPALIRSQKIGAKTVRFNFDWNSPNEVVAKLDEEVGELKSALEEFLSSKENKTANPEVESNVRKEIGDVLFTVAQLARHLGFDSEQILRESNRKFETRFLKMRQLVGEAGLELSDLKVGELEPYWQKAKELVG